MDADGELFFDTTPIGVHTAVEIKDDTVDVNGKLETLPCLFATQKIWKRNKNAVAAIKRLFAEGKLHNSWEIASYEYSFADGVKTITGYEFEGNTFLGYEFADPAYGKDAKVVSLSQTDELMVAEALSRDLIDQKSSKEDETLKKNKTSAQVEPQVDPQVDPQATEPAVEPAQAVPVEPTVEPAQAEPQNIEPAQAEPAEPQPAEPETASEPQPEEPAEPQPEEPQGEPVVGQLQFAADFVVARDEPLVAHPADVLEPARRFIDVLLQDLSLLVKVVQRDILLQQQHFDLRPVVFCAERGDLPFQICLPDAVPDFPSFVKRLGKVDVVVVRPVRGVGARGLGQSLLENDGLPEIAAGQSYIQAGQPFAAGAFCAFSGQGLPDTGCLHTQAVFYAEPEQFVDTQRPHLRLCGGCERHQQQGERCLQEHVS